MGTKKKKKKFWPILLIAAFAISLVACSDDFWEEDYSDTDTENSSDDSNVTSVGSSESTVRGLNINVNNSTGELSVTRSAIENTGVCFDETANILATYADYMYGSEESEPGSGWCFGSTQCFGGCGFLQDFRVDTQNGLRTFNLLSFMRAGFGRTFNLERNMRKPVLSFFRRQTESMLCIGQFFML